MYCFLSCLNSQHYLQYSKQNIITILRFEAIKSRQIRNLTTFFITRNNNILSKLNNVENPNKSAA